MARTKQQRLVEDRLWELLEPLIPPRPVARGPGGRPRIGDRAALEGILFVLDTGCRWCDFPPELGCGSGHTAWRRLREWQDAGVWDRLHHLVLDELRSPSSQAARDADAPRPLVLMSVLALARASVRVSVRGCVLASVRG